MEKEPAAFGSQAPLSILRQTIPNTIPRSQIEILIIFRSVFLLRLLKTLTYSVLQGDIEPGVITL